MTTIPVRILHPRHGIHEPTGGTPARTAGSVRRTTTIDMLRPDGFDRPMHLVGHGRDLRTFGPGDDRRNIRVLGEATMFARVDFAAGRELREITSGPARPALAGLVGHSVASGFRARLDALDPTLIAENDLLHLLLDDLPGASLVSGHAYSAAAQDARDGPQAPGSDVPRTPPMRQGDYRYVTDLCAGFATGGTIMNEVEAFGRSPVVTGPVAPSLARPGDPLAWHDIPPLPPRGMRRARRVDVRLHDRGALAHVDALFRDSYVLPEGVETVIHEYTVTAEVDTTTSTFLSCEATPRALPFVECPAAAASATRLAGMPLAGLRPHVRRAFTGTSTCTHLNDTLRALEDIPALLAPLRAG
ncbi:DUF2889 domain-containing protein [Frankia gtarii]|uniref:DUF2889 domain-containing protein n=1 Tax=Frankia gtarii TaxID=2950102 RepID=UPI0021BE0AAB|nr:DUF2889 domain-containing protein [Frankia gtarii]